MGTRSQFQKLGIGQAYQESKVASNKGGVGLGELSLLSPGVGKSSTSLLAGVKAGRVHLCRVADNTV